MILRGIMGRWATFHSTNKKRSKATDPIVSMLITNGEAQAKYVPPDAIGIRRNTTATVEVAAPRKSIFRKFSINSSVGLVGGKQKIPGIMQTPIKGARNQKNPRQVALQRGSSANCARSFESLSHPSANPAATKGPITFPAATNAPKIP